LPIFIVHQFQQRLWATRLKLSLHFVIDDPKWQSFCWKHNEHQMSHPRSQRPG
jgi:hypothetical protein